MPPPSIHQKVATWRDADEEGRGGGEQKDGRRRRVQQNTALTTTTTFFALSSKPEETPPPPAPPCSLAVGGYKTHGAPRFSLVKAVALAASGLGCGEPAVWAAAAGGGGVAMAVAMVVELVGCEHGALLEECKRRLRSLFWRVRAEIRRQVGRERSRRQRFSFHYDAFSYALNFDDGCSGFFC
ncbi:hypothetical protein Taro_026443 [Colocasia esculenta]|uniref:Uncharacterized protein n=1 Tax=Colocasia esculenta TaxID=4460 RepID=A0A843VH47_COLES|nr:hypothetical protein [Colocasia esculenta]